MKTKTKKILFRLFSLIMITLLVLNLIITITGLGGKSLGADVFSEITSSGVAGEAVATGIILITSIAFSGIPLLIIIVIKLGLIIAGFVGMLFMSGIVRRIRTKLG